MIKSIQVKSVLLAASALSIGFAAPAFAQNKPADEAEDKEAIVVTGTLIRGIAPGGSQTIGVGTEKLETVGAANTSDLLSAIPQAGGFIQFNAIRGASNFSQSVNRPILRYLGNPSSSTASTLLLVDGHRLPGMGINQTSGDIDAIAVSAIERIEIVTDGGSSTYGSDAVGGVFNIITRKNFDGVEAKASYGFGDDFKQTNASIIAGKTWENGSAYVAYDYSWHDEIYGADRDWSQSRNWILGLPSDTNCTPGNLLFGTNPTIFALPGLAGGNGNRCDNSELATFYPRETKHSVTASLSLDNGGPVSYMVKAFYVNRESLSDGGALTANINVPATSPFYIPVTGQTGTETFRVSFADLFGAGYTSQVTKLDAFGITPSVKADLGSGFQLNAFVNYGKGHSTFFGNLLFATPLQTAATAGTFNPANLSAAGNAATITTAKDWIQAGRAYNTLVNARAVVDGSLFTLPGGDVGVAIGVETMHEKYQGAVNRAVTNAGFAAMADTFVSRSVRSVFGEVSIPVIKGLTLSGSGRYDEYSDFGHTFNPKLGATFEPVDWLKLRGNWGRAFQAPGLSDIAQATAQSANALPTSLRPFFDPATPAPTAGHNAFILAVGGTIPGLKPQKAETWSLGLDVKVPNSGLAFGGTYYNINFQGVIGIAPINLPTFYKLYSDKAVLFTAGDAAMQTYYNQIGASVSAASLASALATVGGNFANVYAVLDGRTSNIRSVKTSGLDFYGRYVQDTSFGDVSLDVAGNYILTFANGGTTGTLSTIAQDGENRFKLSSTLGANLGNLKTQVTWQHTGGTTFLPTAANLNDGNVSGMDVINLFLQYKVPESSTMMSGLTFSVNVDNVFDVDPPFYNGNILSLFGVANGFTLGRIFRFGVSKKF